MTSTDARTGQGDAQQVGPQHPWSARPLRSAGQLIVVPAPAGGVDRCTCLGCAAQREARPGVAYRLYERRKHEERLHARLLGSEELRRRVDAALSRAGVQQLDMRAHARKGLFDRMGFLRDLRRWAAAIRGSERRTR